MATSLRLTYIPIPESEHVYLNGVEMRRDIDWSIDGAGLITCLSPMDERSADKLECRYAHKGLTHEIELGNLASNSGSSPVTMTFSSPPAAGASVIMKYQAAFSGASGTVTGLGATWTRLATIAGGTGSADSRPTELWLGVGCNGTGTTVTVTGDDMTISGIEVIGGLSSIGAQIDTAVNPDFIAGPLTATSMGVAVYMSVIGLSGPVETPSSGWTTVSSLFKVQIVSAGTTVGISAASWAHTIVAVIH